MFTMGPKLPTSRLLTPTLSVVFHKKKKNQLFSGVLSLVISVLLDHRH